MFIFGLCSTSDDQSNPSKNVDQTIKKKNGLLKKIKCSFLDYGPSDDRPSLRKNQKKK